MKLKYLFSAILSSLLLLIGCEQEPIGTFEDIKLSSTNVSIPAEGGEVSITMTATKDWAFVKTDLWPDVVVYKTVNDEKVVDEEKTKPSWLKLEGPMEGIAGEYTLKFSAEAVSGGRDLTLEIVVGSHSQYVSVRQGTKAVEDATCADVIAGVDGKVYRVTGVCTSIANDLYGNWYINDGTGEVYVYGTLDKDGATKNYASWKMAVGDVVTIEGPRKDYNGTIELVDVTVLNIEKSLVKLETESQLVEKAGGEIDVKVAYKGAGLFPSIPEKYKTWVSVVGMDYIPGEPTKIEQNPADTAIVKLAVLANGGAPRAAEVEFSSYMMDSDNNKVTSSVTYSFEQEGSLLQIADGFYWLIANNAGAYVAASPVPANKGYGYLGVAEATATSAPGASAFLFTAVAGGYTIQDPSGRYYYMKGTYDNFNVSVTLPESGHIWVLIENEDGTVKIQNVEMKKYMQYDTAYNSWGAYATAKGIMPALVAGVAQVVANGKYHIMVSAGAATTLEGKTYGYLTATEKSAANACTFTFEEGKGYTIADAAGNYYYQKGTYNSFNWSATPSEGQYWSVIPQADGKVKILNLLVKKWWQYSTSYSSFGSYDAVQSGSELPTLVVVE